MKTVELPIGDLHEATWNPNRMDQSTSARLKESLARFGLVIPLVVRPLAGNGYEVLNGNQRLRVLNELGIRAVPCVVVSLHDAEAKLLAEALNQIRGEDDLAAKGELLKDVLSTIPQERILSLLPETVESLRSLSTMKQEDLAEHLKAWQDAQAARLKHMQLQFTARQLVVVEKALMRIWPQAKTGSFDNPNPRGNAFYLLCLYYLERTEIE